MLSMKVLVGWRKRDLRRMSRQGIDVFAFRFALFLRERVDGMRILHIPGGAGLDFIQQDIPKEGRRIVTVECAFWCEIL